MALKLVKTFRFDATRTMALSASTEPEQTTMPCHVTAAFHGTLESRERSLAYYVETCGAFASLLKASFNGRNLDTLKLGFEPNAANLADYFFWKLACSITAAQKKHLRLEKLQVMFGVIEQAESKPRAKAKLHFAWEPKVEDHATVKQRFGQPRI